MDFVGRLNGRWFRLTSVLFVLFVPFNYCVSNSRPPTGPTPFGTGTLVAA